MKTKSAILSAATLLAAIVLNPASATAESVATGCLTKLGVIDRLSYLHTSPTRACRAGENQVSVLIETPGVAFAKRRATITKPGSPFAEAFLIEPGDPRFAPFFLRVVLNDGGACLVVVNIDSEAEPMLLVGVGGSEANRVGEPSEDELTSVILVGLDPSRPDLAATIAAPLFIVAADGSALQVSEALVIHDVDPAGRVSFEKGCYGAVTLRKAANIKDFMAK